MNSRPTIIAKAPRPLSSFSRSACNIFGAKVISSDNYQAVCANDTGACGCTAEDGVAVGGDDSIISNMSR